MTLAGKHILVTAGPTHEPIDPVRVIANRSSGRQGFAIAAAAADAGARVTLVAGPVSLDTPAGVQRVNVETAEQMADATFAALPADAAILVAAVADWRVESSPTKLKKGETTKTPVQTQFGWHIIQLTDERPMKIPTFDEAKDRLAQMMAQQSLQRVVADLRSKAKITE